MMLYDNPVLSLYAEKSTTTIPRGSSELVQFRLAKCWPLPMAGEDIVYSLIEISGNRGS